MACTSFHVLLVGEILPDVFYSEPAATRPARNTIQFSRVSTYAEAIQLICCGRWDAILVRSDFDGHTGLEFIHHARLIGLGAPLVLLSDAYDASLDYKARKIGAADLVSVGMLDMAYLLRLMQSPAMQQPDRVQYAMRERQPGSSQQQQRGVQ
jgi:hypothetical protein